MSRYHHTRPSWLVGKQKSATEKEKRIQRIRGAHIASACRIASAVNGSKYLWINEFHLKIDCLFLTLSISTHPTIIFTIYIGVYVYRVSQEERAKLREGVPYVKLYRYNPKHLCPKLNGYGDKGQRKVWSSCGSTYCTWFAWRNTHTLRIVCPCLQLAQARSSLRLHM